MGEVFGVGLTGTPVVGHLGCYYDPDGKDAIVLGVVWRSSYDINRG